jgi:protein-disulfide isomerase
LNKGRETIVIKQLLTATTAALLLAACGSAGNNTTAAPVAGKAAPAGTEWATTFAETPEGGIRMGNPDAPIKLVEYGSLSCPACAVFSNAASEPLKRGYVATGKVSYEFRSLLLHPQDLMLSNAYKCGGPQPFFAMIEASFADFDSWMGRLQNAAPEELQRIQSLPIAAQNVELARLLGRDEFVVQRGISREALAQCLADPRRAEALMKVRDRAFNELNVQGTPTFFLNGEMLENAATWPAVEAALKAAGA